MNRGELFLKMSRRPKTFLVLLLVAMFLMTQVAVAGAAWNVDWGTWNSGSRSSGSPITGTVYGTTYTLVYASVGGNIINSPSWLAPSANGAALSIPVSSLSSGGKTLSLTVYESDLQTTVGVTPDTAQYVYDNLTYNNQYYTQGLGVSLAYVPMTFSISSSGDPGGPSGGTPTPTPPPTVTAPSSATIDAAKGGSVTSGGITVNVPAGALSGNGTISVTPVTDLSKTPVGTLFKIGSTVVDIVITGATLTGTLTITLDYDKAALANVPAEQIGIYYWNEARGGWVFVGGKVDAATGKVSVDVNHLTKFAIMANPNLKIPADIKDNWAFESIKRLLGMGVVSGYTDGTYKPGNNITRAEFAKIMVDALGFKPATAPSLKFADAAQIGDWAKGYVATAVEKGLIAGYSDNTFKPANQITRAEIATIVVKALGKTAAGTPVFADASSIPAWAQGYVAVAAKEGIVAGYSDNTFKAGNNATRAEAAKMTTNMLTNLKI